MAIDEGRYVVAPGWNRQENGAVPAAKREREQKDSTAPLLVTLAVHRRYRPVASVRHTPRGRCPLGGNRNSRDG